MDDTINSYTQRFITLVYGGLTEVSVWYLALSTFFRGIPFGVLPYKAWTPYDYWEPVVYWCTYIQQLITLIVSANLNIGFDTIILGFIMQICTQFNIFRHRIQLAISDFNQMLATMPDHVDHKTLFIYEQNFVDCVKYHLAIFRY
uniref:Odorant receptor n=1 Tax=Bracon brevicornis TaxID=1563983 RepID=A0A6V7JGG1_9HYME